MYIQALLLTFYQRAPYLGRQVRYIRNLLPKDTVSEVTLTLPHSSYRINSARTPFYFVRDHERNVWWQTEESVCGVVVILHRRFGNRNHQILADTRVSSQVTNILKHLQPDTSLLAFIHNARFHPILLKRAWASRYLTACTEVSEALYSIWLHRFNNRRQKDGTKLWAFVQCHPKYGRTEIDCRTPGTAPSNKSASANRPRTGDKQASSLVGCYVRLDSSCRLMALPLPHIYIGSRKTSLIEVIHAHLSKHDVSVIRPSRRPLPPTAPLALQLIRQR